MLAARDTIATTLTWIFCDLAQNPDIVSIIRNELSPIASRKVALGASTPVIFEPIMPSGHEVHAGDTIFVSVHSMGRMEGVWGKDCFDYNPRRWLSDDDNNLRYIPSHKFLAFNAGPRMCLGKDIALMQMKTVIATAVWNFDVKVVEGQSIQPKPSIILEMKNGLIVKLKKREM
ncbi:unnamed protein product [Triticum aestivum]|uniref:Uncharacterized protein n=1 Tax=Triticum aestivum TaxID=4565 RepID=A0A7H4L9Y8_WHEAT|nr:unnamed protein product [Triticum aestivum]